MVATSQLLHTLFAEEVAHRRGTRLTRAVRAAAFPFLRTIDEFDFTYQSTLRLTTIGSLLAPDFVTEGRSVILEGKPGRGKTHLAIAIAYRAMQNGFDALFTTAAELIEDLSPRAAKAGCATRSLATSEPHVLVVDEVGYLTYGDDAANVLYHVVNDRHIRRRAMIFTTNKHPKRWGARPARRRPRRGDRRSHPRARAPAPPRRPFHQDQTLASRRARQRRSGDDSAGSRVSGNEAAEFPERTPRIFAG